MNAKLYTPFTHSNIINVGFIIGNYTLPEAGTMCLYLNSIYRDLELCFTKILDKCILKMDP